jgi:hypothetical protein
MLTRRGLIAGLGASAFAERLHAQTALVMANSRARGQTIRPRTYDVVVYGATVAGIAAANAAAQNGMRVALLEPTAYLGGITGAGGLGEFDIAAASRTNIGGTFWQVLQRIAILNGTAGQPNWPTTAPPSATSTDAGYFPPSMLNMQPIYCKQAIDNFCFNLYNVDVYINAALVTTGGSVYPAVIMSGLAITGLLTQLGIVTGSVFIDASYEGDVLAGAAAQSKASYTFGRESSAQYGESLAGVAKASPSGYGGTVNYLSGGLPVFPFIANTGAANGSADALIQFAGFRPTIQPIANGGVAFTAPAGYQDSAYAWLGAVCNAASYTTLAQACSLTLMGSNKYCANNLLLDYFNQDNGYADGTPAQRAAIVAGHKAWTQGFFYYVANSPNAPAGLNTNASLFGYAGTEFVDNGNFPYQLYVREGRRMVGEYVMVQADTVGGTSQAHSIGYATYALDNHPSAYYAYAQNQGIVDSITGDATRTNFKLPMEILIPQAGQCTNLLVPVCASVSHVAWQAMRYEAQFAIMGDAAGVMAASAVTGAKSVQSLVYASDVSPKLTTLGAIF